MDLVNSQLMATQQQLQHLSERYQDLAQGHVVLLQQVVNLQKFVKNHDSVMHRVMGFLHGVDNQRRNSRIAPFPGAAGGDTTNDGRTDDHPATPLQQASELLDEYSAENLPNQELEQMTRDYSMRADNYATPPSNEPGASSMGLRSEGGGTNMGYALGNDLENMVYPVGHTRGIDPISSEHINSIPYALPTNGMIPVEAMPDMVPEAASGASRKKSTQMESVWGLSKPRILLVEDDKICARIGSKWLQMFECGVETAVSKSDPIPPFILTPSSAMVWRL